MTIGSGHELKYAAISASSSGSNTLVAAITGQSIKVINLTIVASGTVNVTFRSGSTDLTGAIPLVANGGFSVTGSSDCVLFETAKGEALNANLSAAIAVNGFLTYIAEA